MKFLIKCFWYCEAICAIIMVAAFTFAIASEQWTTRLGAVLVGAIAMYVFAGGLALIRKP